MGSGVSSGPVAGVLGACFGLFPRRLWRPIFEPQKGSEKAQKQPKTAQNLASEAFRGPSGDPEIQTRATFPEWKNDVFLHVAAIFDEQIAWDTVKYWVSAFAETRKPRILHIEMYFFNDFIDQMREKSLIFMKNHLLSFEKTCFRGVKTRVLGTLISLKISKIVPSDALARVFGGSKRAQKS